MKRENKTDKKEDTRQMPVVVGEAHTDEGDNAHCMGRDEGKKQA